MVMDVEVMDVDVMTHQVVCSFDPQAVTQI
jgi:hypothetical protein